MPDLISVLSGDYYIKAMSHQLKQVDTKAYFEGTSEVFSIKPSTITEVKPITCEMKNIKAVVTFDEALKNFGDRCYRYHSCWRELPYLFRY